MANPRRITGTVVSDKPDQTVIVATERRVVHPIYRKSYAATKRLAAHDPDNRYKTGDTVTIQETRPLSATKRFIVITPDSAPATAKSPK